MNAQKTVSFAITLIFIWGLSFSKVKAQSRIPYQYTPEKPEFRNPNSFFLPDTTLNKKRLAGVLGLTVGSYGFFYGALGAAWYKDVTRSKFHFFNDYGEWMHIDKFGHVLGGYQGARAKMQILKWAGVNKKQTLIWGGITGFVMLSTIEVFDGFAEEWGASIPDLASNLIGAGIAIGNEALWNDQRIQVKISFHPTKYAKLRPNVLGENVSQWVKDYNGHTLWLSFRVHSFLPEGKFKDNYPPWLNLALGYGAEGILGGYTNAWKDADGNFQDYRDVPRIAQFYLALDVDLSKIPTQIGFLKWLFGTINFIRIPAPAVEFSPEGVKFYPFYF